MAIRNILDNLNDGVRFTSQYNTIIGFDGPATSEYPVHILIQRVNNYVTLEVSPTRGPSNGNSTFFYSLSPIPSQFRPKSIIQSPIIVNNNTTIVGGIYVLPDGNINITGGPGFQSPFNAPLSTIIGSNYSISITYSVA